MMRMQGLLALMHRSLRVDDRSLRTHLFRLLFLVFTYFMLVTAQSASRYSDAAGLQLFEQLCSVDFFFIVLAAVGLFASAISEEKEEMTLGLLKMAGVNGLTLLLGKFVPRLLLGAILLVAQIPFVMLAITLGGVAWNQIAGGYVVLMTFLFFVANVGLLCSVIAPRSQTASALATALLFLYFAGPWVLVMVAEVAVTWGWLVRGGSVFAGAKAMQDFMVTTSAYDRLYRVLSTGGSRDLVHVQSISNTLAGMACFLASWACYDRFTADANAGAPARPFAAKTASIPATRLFAPGRAWNRAVMWKDFHFHAGGKVSVLVQCLIYTIVMLIVCGFQLYYDRQIAWEANAFGLITASMTVAGLMCATLAARVFAEEVKWKTLTSLSLVPQSTVSLIVSKVLGAALALLPSVCCFAAGWCVFLWNREDRISFWYNMNSEDLAWCVWVLLQYVLLLHLAAVASLFVKWGALPIAIGVQFIVLFVMATMASSEKDMLGLGSVLALVGVPILQVWIIERFVVLAAD